MKRTILLAVFFLCAIEQHFAVAQYLNFTSANNASFTVGQAGSFTVTTVPTDLYNTTYDGLPPILDTSGNPPPAGISFTDNGDFTASLSGNAIFAGSAAFMIRAFAPTGTPGVKGVLLQTQAFGVTVGPGQTTTTVTPICDMRTFTENQPYSYGASVSPVGSGTVQGTMTYTQNPPGTVLCSLDVTAAPVCSTTSLATSGSDTQDSYLLEASFAPSTSDWQPSSGFTIAVTVLSAADVVFRNGLESAVEGCPVQ